MEFNQSDEDYETPELFPIFCALCMSSQWSVGVMYEDETRQPQAVVDMVLAVRTNCELYI